MNLAARLALLFALLAAPFCVPSQAADYEVAPSLVCDTQEQVERFVALFSGDAQAAIRVVNAEQKTPTACAMMNIAFMRGNKERTVEITSRVLHLDKPVIERVYDEQIGIFTADGRFDPKALVVLRQSLVEMGILQQVPEDSVMFTTRFVPVKF